MQRVVADLVSFTTDQAIKTAGRPSRVFLIPYRVFVRPALLRILRFALLVTNWCFEAFRVPARLVPGPVAFMIAYDRFVRGSRLLNDNKPKEAACEFAKCIEFSSDSTHFSVAAVNLQVGLGLHEKAIELHNRSNRIRLTQRNAAGLQKYDYCFLDLFWASHIGHIATIDYVVKLRMLQRCDPKNTILYVPPNSNIPNPYLVEQWRPHLRLITNPGQLPFAQKYAKLFALDYYVPWMKGTTGHYWWDVAAEANHRWSAEGRKPLLNLPLEAQERGRKALASVGVPPDAWFVGLHVRESGFAHHHRELHGVLNANIEDYLPAIQEIVQRGGWVIRMGDPSMKALPPLTNLLDYCHSAVRSDWMDVFLAATSRFFVGTSSGVCYVAQAYGVPCVLTNWWPPAQRPWHTSDIFLPKILQRVRGSQPLSLEESLSEPFGYCNSISHLQEAHGVRVLDNHPEDIRAAVNEMIERIEGQPAYEEHDIKMRGRAESIYASTAMRLYQSPSAFGAAALARDFVRRNQSFLAT